VTFANAGRRYWAHSNHLFSVAALTDAAGNVTERYKYDAYGKQTITLAVGAVRTKSAVVFNRGFTGYVVDGETGKLNARARMYSPASGQYCQRNEFGTKRGFRFTSPVEVILRKVPSETYNRRLKKFIKNTLEPTMVFSISHNTEVVVLASSGMTINESGVHNPWLNYIDGYSLYIRTLALDPSGEPTPGQEMAQEIVKKINKAIKGGGAASDPGAVNDCLIAAQALIAGEGTCLDMCTACAVPFDEASNAGAICAWKKCAEACEK